MPSIVFEDALVLAASIFGRDLPEKRMAAMIQSKRKSSDGTAKARGSPYPNPMKNVDAAEQRSDVPAIDRMPPEALRVWLNYQQAADYCGWSVPYLRNLVSAGRVPVFGRPRVRRFRRDMLDRFLTDPDAAMRLFRAERQSHGS